MALSQAGHAGRTLPGTCAHVGRGREGAVRVVLRTKLRCFSQAIPCGREANMREQKKYVSQAEDTDQLVGSREVAESSPC